MQQFTVKQPPTLNELLNASRANKYKAANLKRYWTKFIASCEEVKSLTPYRCPVWMAVEATYMRTSCDGDNIYACMKFVNDGLVKAGILTDDSVKEIKTPTWFEYVKGKEKLITVRLFDNQKEYFEFISQRMLDTAE